MECVSIIRTPMLPNVMPIYEKRRKPIFEYSLCGIIYKIVGKMFKFDQLLSDIMS